MVKFHTGQLKNLKQTFCKFQGHTDLEGQGKGHCFTNPSKAI